VEQLVLALSEIQNDGKLPIASIIAYSSAYLMDYGVNVLGIIDVQYSQEKRK
jgi:hypothetical protein